MVKKILLLLLLILAVDCCSDKQSTANTQKREFHRVISLAPSITETVYALEAQDKLVGITNFCNYPEDTKNKTKIGGYSNLNYEAVLQLKPDLVLLLPEHKKAMQEFDKLKINYKIIPQKTIPQIKQSIIKIGNLLNKIDNAKKLVLKFDAILKNPEYLNPVKKNKILIVVSRTPGTLKNIFVAGPDIFYNDLIEMIGCKNVVPESHFDYPMINSESLISLNPDIIIEIFSPDNKLIANKKPEELANDWQKLKFLNAVKNNNIFYIINNYAVIPGPRILKLYKDFKSIYKKAKK